MSTSHRNCVKHGIHSARTKWISFKCWDFLPWQNSMLAFSNATKVLKKSVLDLRRKRTSDGWQRLGFLNLSCIFLRSYAHYLVCCFFPMTHKLKKLRIIMQNCRFWTNLVTYWLFLKKKQYSICETVYLILSHRFSIHMCQHQICDMNALTRIYSFNYLCLGHARILSLIRYYHTDILLMSCI